MNFIVDALLPPQLAMWIRNKGFSASSLRELGLQGADDATIWDLAERESAVIITKDEDFVLLAAARQGPGVPWIRTGNLVNRMLLVRFEGAGAEVVAHLQSGARVVELR